MGTTGRVCLYDSQSPLLLALVSHGSSCELIGAHLMESLVVGSLADSSSGSGARVAGRMSAIMFVSRRPRGSLFRFVLLLHSVCFASDQLDQTGGRIGCDRERCRARWWLVGPEVDDVISPPASSQTSERIDEPIGTKDDRATPVNGVELISSPRPVSPRLLMLSLSLSLSLSLVLSSTDLLKIFALSVDRADRPDRTAAYAASGTV